MRKLVFLLLFPISVFGFALTTYSGSISINKKSQTLIDIEYQFVLDQTDSIFSSDSFQSYIQCSGTSAKAELTNFIEAENYKQFLNCSKTLYNWVVIYKKSIDLSQTEFSALASCCNLRIDATTGKRSTMITSLSKTSRFYVYTDFENCNTTLNITPASTAQLFSYNCLNQPFFFNQGRLDTANLDSLSYTLTSPLEDINSPIAFKSGYSPIEPLKSYFGFYLDSITGDLYYTPVSATDAGPLTYEVSEWRKDNNGTPQKISTSHVEYFVQTSQCPENNPPKINGPYAYNVCEGDQLCFNITSEDPVFVPPPPATPPAADTVTLTWNAGIPTASFTIIDPKARLQTGRFCWTPQEGQASDLPYNFTVTARDNACPNNATTTRSFRIRVSPRARATNKFTRLTDSSYQIIATTSDDFKGIPSYNHSILDSGSSVILDHDQVYFKSTTSYLSSQKTDTIVFKQHGIYIIASSINNVPLNCPSMRFDTLYFHTLGIKEDIPSEIIIYPNPANT